MQLQEVFIDWKAEHQRCDKCGEVILFLTRDFIMVLTDAQLKNFDADKLPPDFNANRLPTGTCPDCKTDMPFETVAEAKAWLGEGNLIAELCDEGIMSVDEFIAHVNFLREQVREDRKMVNDIVDDIPF